MALPFGVGTEQNANTATEQFGDVPDSCAVEPTQQGDTWSIPLFDRACPLAILPDAGPYWGNVDEDYQMKGDDLAVLLVYFREKNPDSELSKNSSQMLSDIARVYNAQVKDKKISELPETFTGTDIKPPIEQVQGTIDSVTGIFGFITNPDNILRLLAITVGGMLVLFGSRKLME